MSSPGADPPDESRGIRACAIDIGTNAVLLLVAERRAGKLVALCERSTITRLGEGVGATGELTTAARQRTLTCIADYARTLRELGATRVGAVGTSAMRDARGGAELADEVAAVLGSRPRILSGEEEAVLTFRGSLSDLELRGTVGVFDIGGGSTEIILGEAGPELRMIAAASLDVGSVRLFERHVTSDPPSRAELERIRSDIDSALDAAPTVPQNATLVGVAGTVTSLAAIALGKDCKGWSPHGLRLPASEVSRTARLLESLTIERRVALSGLEPGRADVIVVGAALAEAIVKRTGARELVVSDRGVRWGLAEALLAEPPGAFVTPG